MTRLAASEVALDPEWIPHAFDRDGQELTFVFVPRAARKDLVFLTDGQFRGAYQKAALPAASVAAETEATHEAPLHFIFHSSFCCSTLLAKALAVEGIAASLSEPNILVNLAERMMRAGHATNQSALELSLQLLRRPLASRESIIVKASSFANALIQPILGELPGSRAVLLYSDVQTFLTSVLKRGLLGRVNARKLYRSLIGWTSLDFGFSAAETFEQTDLQIAALAWLMQIAHFRDVAIARGPEQVILLDAADLLARPAAELQRVQSFFGLGLDEDRIRAIVGGVFAKHSKFLDRDYDSASRERDQDALVKVHAEELGMVIHWLTAVAAHLGVRLRPEAAT
jgi:hypothetical protein